MNEDSLEMKDILDQIVPYPSVEEIEGLLS